MQAFSFCFFFLACWRLHTQLAGEDGVAFIKATIHRMSTLDEAIGAKAGLDEARARAPSVTVARALRVARRCCYAVLLCCSCVRFMVRMLAADNPSLLESQSGSPDELSHGYENR